MNPKWIKFVEEHPNMTLLGLSWALYWRLAVVTFGVYIALAVVWFFLAGATGNL